MLSTTTALRDSAACLQRELPSKFNFDVIANPHELSPYRTREMAMRVSPKLLIEHSANNECFKEKTIYNELSAMRSRGLLATLQPYGEILTLFGRKELERLNLVGGL